MQDSAASSSQRGFAQNLIDVYFAPRETFAAIVRNPRFWAPVVAFLIVSVGFTGIWMHNVDPAEFLKTQLEESGRWEKIPAESRAQVLETQAQLFPVLGPLGSLVGFAATVLGIPAVLLFVFRFFYASELSYRQAVTLVTYCFLAYSLLTSPLTLLVLSLRGDWNLNPGEALQANLSLLLDKSSTARPLYALLGSLDLFSLWLVWLLATAFGVASRRSTGSALWGVAVPWAVLVAGKVVVASF